MCGLTGILNLDHEPVSGLVLRRMTDSLAHRGPDGEGFFVDGCVGLGHRRLAIIDTSPAGHQPMMTADRRYVIVFNGEIYNFQELRIELEAHGMQFHSRSDTEVLLNAYVFWGRAAVARLNGMFAFAIWDSKTSTLVLGRDRYGTKPLYYALSGRSLLFGSEVKALLQHASLRARLDREALLEYFTFQNFLSDRTLFQDVRLLPAGCCLEARAGDVAPVQGRYWDFHFEEPTHSGTDAEYEEELDRLFRQAVERQLVSDVELGSYLSGGMDSGSVTAVAAQRIDRLKTFTCGFDMRSASGLELGFDERANAEFMSYCFRTEHYEVVLKAGDMEHVMPALGRHLEEPRIGQSYPNSYAAKLASRFVKVVLSGGGGDELFGGYPWRYYRAVSNGSFDEYYRQVLRVLAEIAAQSHPSRAVPADQV